MTTRFTFVEKLEEGRVLEKVRKKQVFVLPITAEKNEHYFFSQRHL